MIDYFFKFANEAAAIADAAGSIYYQAGSGWNADRVAPGLQVWRPSQDTVDANGNTIHTYLPGWFGVISLNRIAPALLNHANLQIAIDRTAANSGQSCVLKSNLSPVVLQDIQFQPVFAGANYPFGNFT